LTVSFVTYVTSRPISLPFVDFSLVLALCFVALSSLL
jgi:hypothetical protein